MVIGIFLLFMLSILEAEAAQPNLSFWKRRAVSDPPAGGSLYCWGHGTSGQIGNGASASTNVPLAVTLPSGVTEFSEFRTGGVNVCALPASGANAGKAYCWGTGTHGQLGDGAATNRNVPTMVSHPVGILFGSIRAGYRAACGIASGADLGKLYCWGENENGEFGNGTQSQYNSPTLTTFPSGVTGFGKMDAGDEYHCAIASAGANAGMVYCAGETATSTSGSTTNVSSVTTMTLEPAPSGVTAFGEIAAEKHGCAIASAGANTGKIYCWGRNQDGQLGNGNTNFSADPTEVTMPSGVTAFGKIDSGDQHVCALPSAGANMGTLYCWGRNTNGQLGDGTLVNKYVPTAVPFPSGVTAFEKFSAGSAHTCAIASAGANAGQAYCWGNNASGQLGNGTTATAVSTPTLVNVPAGKTSYSEIQVGGSHTCGSAN